jgi:ABC-type transport system substrate-binding protein
MYSEPVSILPAASEYCVAGYTYEYDPDLAQSYMDESGLTNVSLSWVTNSGSAGATMSEAFGAYLSQLGITLNIEVYDILTCLGIWETPYETDFQTVCDSNTNASCDPYQLVQYLGEGQSFYCANRVGTEINDLINAGAFNVEHDARAEAYAALQEYVYNDYSVIPLCEWSTGLGYNGAITGTRIIGAADPNLRFINFG